MTAVLERRNLLRSVGVALLCIMVGALFMNGAPTGGAFSWPDSPRHALNGAFVLDLIKTAPLNDPLGYAQNYYAQYPALTIGFYPPLFSFQLAMFYAVLGVSQQTAVIALFVSYCLLVWGTFFLARLWLSDALAFGIAVLFAFLPEVSYWGRQVMLEIPAYAFLVWSVYFFVRHIREERIGFLYLSVFLLILAMYTKLSVAFVAVPYLISLLHARGASLFRNRHSYVIAALSIVGIAPLVFLTLKLGQANIQSAAGIADSSVSRLSLAGWTWYAEKLPSQLGWPAFVAVVVAIAIAMAKREWRDQLRRDHFLWISWFVVGYIFFASIDLKETRHSLFLLLPLVMILGLACSQLSRQRAWLGEMIIAVIALATLFTTVTARHVHFVDGYRDVVRFVSEVAPPNSNVLFSGYRDGSFIFEMRADADRPDMSVIRADKLLLRIAVRRGLGVEQKNYTEAEIAALIDKLGVRYVVAQPDFWTDLEQMRRLQNVLHGPQFAEVKRFPIIANYPGQENELVVFRNLGEVAKGPVNVLIELPIIGSAVSGSVSKSTGAPAKP